MVYRIPWRNVGSHGLYERRIEQAKRLLAETKRTLADIALELGFASQSHFTVSFCEVVGLPPNRYRRWFGRTVRQAVQPCLPLPADDLKIGCGETTRAK